MENRLQGWAGRALSMGGRLVLLNSVLTATPLYLLSYFFFPTWVIQRLDRIRRNFLWAGTNNAKQKYHLVNWGRICRDRTHGGLGIINLRNMNLALLSKRWWRWMIHPENRAARLTASKYAPKTGTWFGIDKLNYNTSRFHRDVKRAKQLLLAGCRFKVGDGSRVRFWEDHWTDGAPLTMIYPTLYAKVIDKNVSVASQRRGGRWWLRVPGPLNNKESRLKRQMRTSLPLTTSVPDIPIWIWDKNGNF